MSQKTTLRPSRISQLPTEAAPQLTDAIAIQDVKSNMVKQTSLATIKTLVEMTPLQVVGAIDSALQSTQWRQGFGLTTGNIIAPTLNQTLDGLTLDGTASPGTSITLLYLPDQTAVLDSQGQEATTTVGSDGNWTISDISPQITDGQQLRVRSQSFIGDVRVTDATVVVGQVDTTAPTGSVAFVFPNGTQSSPSTTLSVDVSGITDDIDDVATLQFAYQWGYLQSGSFVEFAGATGATFDPVAAGQTPSNASEILVRVTVEDTSGNSRVLVPPRTAVPESAFLPSSGEIIYNYVENFA